MIEHRDVIGYLVRQEVDIGASKSKCKQHDITDCYCATGGVLVDDISNGAWLGGITSTSDPDCCHLTAAFTSQLGLFYRYLSVGPSLIQLQAELAEIFRDVRCETKGQDQKLTPPTFPANAGASPSQKGSGPNSSRFGSSLLRRRPLYPAGSPESPPRRRGLTGAWSSCCCLEDFGQEPKIMASLADSFLADLDELSDNEAYPEEENAEAVGTEEIGDDDMPDLESLNYDDLDSVSKLQKTQRYNDIMQKVENALQKGTDFSNQGSILEEDPEYQLIVDCNALSVDIENEIIIIHNFIRDKYRLKFPELESLVHHPIDYARVVQNIGNEMDLTLVDLEGLLPSAIIMVISVTASTTSGKPLSEENLVKTIEACERALTLDAAKKKVLEFVESRMGYIAPNLSAIVGSAVASKLMGTAGGLGALAKMPACNVQLLGAKRKNLAGFSTATSQFRVGYLEQTDVFQSTPPALRTRACRLIAAKSTLAARIDSIRGDPTGKAGRNLLEEIRKKIEKWQEPPPAKLPKPLPVPDFEPKKKRGGDGLGEGYGMLGQAGSGKLRVSTAPSKLSAKITKKFKEKSYGSSGATSGLTSSLAFTPVQGIELSNPQAHGNLLGSGTQSTYFSETGTFSKIKRT
uniref:Nop domain-containing protein n=1 Tax=Oryza meridionalis TaxID=40149 RepID=A0A0E0DGX1_9ORYZ